MIRFSVPTTSLAVCLALSCSGGVGSSDERLDEGSERDTAATDAKAPSPSGPKAPAGETEEEAADPALPSSGEPGGDAGPTPPPPGESTRLARLSHAQYKNTIQDLLGVDDDLTQAFAPDAQNGFGFETSVDLFVDGRLGPQYRAAAEALAARVASSNALLDRLLPCDSSDASCASGFVADFGARAFRRPLTRTELDGFMALFDQGSDLIGSGDDFKDGVALVIEAMLQSPQFLYRTELSDDPSPDGSIPLDDYEIASRLSYFIYNSMPDDELFAAAAAGDLSSAAAARSQVDRMLRSERALASLVDFHAQAWHFSRFSNIAPDPSLLPDPPSDLVSRVQEAARRYVEDLIADEGGLEELLTSPFGYADSALAPLYETSVDDGMERIEFDPRVRRGLLMQVGFLASNAYALKTDPIHRGLFVVRDLLCRVIPDPPPGAANAELPEGVTPPETTREEITLLTSPGECAGCHVQINPPGFAFEGFDAMGRQRSEENGVAVDTSGSLVIDGSNVEFEGPLELIAAVASSDEAWRCYTTKWLEFAHGRRLTSDELAVIDELGRPEAVKQLVANIATANAFLTRIPNEVAR